MSFNIGCTVPHVRGVQPSSHIPHVSRIAGVQHRAAPTLATVAYVPGRTMAEPCRQANTLHRGMAAVRVGVLTIDDVLICVTTSCKAAHEARIAILGVARVLYRVGDTRGGSRCALKPATVLICACTSASFTCQDPSSPQNCLERDFGTRVPTRPGRTVPAGERAERVCTEEYAKMQWKNARMHGTQGARVTLCGRSACVRPCGRSFHAITRVTLSGY